MIAVRPHSLTCWAPDGGPIVATTCRGSYKRAREIGLVHRGRDFVARCAECGAWEEGVILAQWSRP